MIYGIVTVYRHSSFVVYLHLVVCDCVREDVSMLNIYNINGNFLLHQLLLTWLAVSFFCLYRP